MKEKSLSRKIHHDDMSKYILERNINWAGLSFAELRLKQVRQALSKTSAHTHKIIAHNPAYYHLQNLS